MGPRTMVPIHSSKEVKLNSNHDKEEMMTHLQPTLGANANVPAVAVYHTTT